MLLPRPIHRAGMKALICLLATAAASAHAGPIPDELRASAAALRDSALEGSPAYDIVESLTMEIGPRLAGSPGDRAAVAWAVDKLRELGLENVRTQEVEVPQWERGTLEVTLSGTNPMQLAATSLGGSVGTRASGIEAEVVRVESLEDLQSRGAEQITGRIVFIDRRMERARDGSGYGRTVPIRLYGAREAAKLGARAVVIRSVGTSENRVPHTGTQIYDLSVRRIPAIALAAPDADLLAWRIATGETPSLRIRSTARQLPPTTSANVIGEIPGRVAPDEIVLLGAHLDSWDLGTGAIDDGAGVGIVAAAAHLIGRQDMAPRRTIRVVLFANEEFGLSGAREYRRMSDQELAAHIIGIEADFGAAPVWRFSSRVAPAALDLIAGIQELLAPLGIEYGNNEAGGGADLRPLRTGGMPVLSLSQDGTHYFDYHHTVNDTIDRIDREEINQNVAAYATAAWTAANLERDFGRLAVEPRESR
jgi:carboxypeptidase Q